MDGIKVQTINKVPTRLMNVGTADFLQILMCLGNLHLATSQKQIDEKNKMRAK